MECSGHTFERVGSILKVGEYYKVQFAIDGKLFPPFFEHASHVEGMNAEEFYQHMQAQSLTLLEA